MLGGRVVKNNEGECYCFGACIVIAFMCRTYLNLSDGAKHKIRLGLYTKLPGGLQKLLFICLAIYSELKIHYGWFERGKIIFGLIIVTECYTLGWVEFNFDSWLGWL